MREIRSENKYYINNVEKINKQSKQFYKKNIKRIKELRYKIYQDNKEKQKEERRLQRQKYISENKEIQEILAGRCLRREQKERKKTEAQYRREQRALPENINKRKQHRRDSANTYAKQKKLTNPVYKITCNIRSLVCNSFRNNFTVKSKKTNEILGCSFEEFKNHLEKQFDEHMNWNNQGSYWEMDHIKPISLATSEEEVYKLNHYTNFQPLEKTLNKRKHNHYKILNTN